MEAAEAGLTSPDKARDLLRIKQTAVTSLPLRRVGTPQDVANAIAFLSSDVSSFVTGQTLSVNGGRFMK